MKIVLQGMNMIDNPTEISPLAFINGYCYFDLRSYLLSSELLVDGRLMWKISFSIGQYPSRFVSDGACSICEQLSSAFL